MTDTFLTPHDEWLLIGRICDQIREVEDKIVEEESKWGAPPPTATAN